MLVQDSLFLPPGVQSGEENFPPILRTYEGVEEILQNPYDGIGLDLEFSPKTGRPTILGVSNRAATAGVPWDAELARKVVETVERYNVPIVGHAVIGADRPVLEGALGISTPLRMWDDTIIRHYICNPDLCKTPGKDEDDDDTGAIGYMNLWTMASLYTDLPVWKTCRGKACDGPCPIHDPFGYCAVDSWAGLESKFGTVAEMGRKGIPESLALDLMELSEITHRMETRGIKIDRAYVREMEENFDALKLEIFPYELINGKKVYSPFNPKSPAQISEFFKAHGIELRDTDKKTVKKVLEKEAKRRGLDMGSLGTIADLPPEIDALYRLFEFKDAGKGLKSWFDDRYIDANGFIHSRFIVPGTSMGRLASARPNNQNIPARGFGARVRRAYIPRSSDKHFVKADYSQLEFRKMLHAAGVDPEEVLPADPFIGLVQSSNGKMKPAAAFLHGSERDVAKSLVHAFDYMEGFTWLSSRDLDRRKNEIEKGALLVYKDWEYRGGVVGFTGGNLAERLFGNKSWEARRDALELQELVAAEFPYIRQLQRKILREVEDRRGVQLQTGRFLPLYGSPEDDAKMATAMHGQGGGGDHVQSVMLMYRRAGHEVPVLQVHDELVFEIPADWTEAQARDFIHPMTGETSRMPGFRCPVKAKRGTSWGEMKEFPI